MIHSNEGNYAHTFRVCRSWLKFAEVSKMLSMKSFHDESFIGKNSLLMSAALNKEGEHP